MSHLHFFYFQIEGKLGHGDVQLHRLIPTVVDTLQGISVCKMASMSTYAIAIDTSGVVYVWGTGGSAGVAAHQNHKADILPQILEALPPKAHVVDISCGLGHALFLLKSGRVYSWGNGGNGRLGLGDTSDRTEACNVTALNMMTITAVMCGASHSMALTSSGRVYSWGKNTQGQCGTGGSAVDGLQLLDVPRPTMVRHKLEDAMVVQLSAGWEHSLALCADGKLFSWGCGYKDSRRGVIPPVLGLGNNEAKSSPEPISSMDHVVVIKITCGWDHCLALDDSGRVMSWGSGQNGKLGHGSEENVASPTYITALDGMDVEHIAAGCEHSACITKDGVMLSWGHGDGGRLGHGSNSQSFSPTPVVAVKLMNVRSVQLIYNNVSE
jgi:alpha-tubulin suppressor-like RCC1 family protein